MKTAYTTALELRDRVPLLFSLPTGSVATLVRASRTLSRWGELECGNGNDYASWAIERDEVTGKPFLVTHPNKGKSYRRPVPDREAGALRRIAEICKTSGLHFFHQTDPRGTALYVSNEPLADSAYTQGVAIG